MGAYGVSRVSYERVFKHEISRMYVSEFSTIHGTNLSWRALIIYALFYFQKFDAPVIRIYFYG